MNEVKVTPKRFGAIATYVTEDGATPTAIQIIHGWREATDKVRVFGKKIECQSGVMMAKTKEQPPKLREVFEDHYLSLRSQGPLILATPTIFINPKCVEICQYAEKHNMSIAWMFYAFAGNCPIPCLIGLSPQVVRILISETPEEIGFHNDDWREWLFKWMKKTMLSHRCFDATQMDLVANFNSEPEQVCIADTMPQAVVEIKKKPGRKKKA